MSVSKYFEVRPGPVTTIRFTQSELFDTIMVDELRDDLTAFAEHNLPDKLLLDFGEVEFCSTSMINTLLRVKKIVSRDHQGELKLCGMKDNVRSAFEMLNLDGTIFEIYDAVDDAIAAFDA